MRTLLWYKKHYWITAKCNISAVADVFLWIILCRWLWIRNTYMWYMLFILQWTFICAQMMHHWISFIWISSSCFYFSKEANKAEKNSWLVSLFKSHFTKFAWVFSYNLRKVFHKYGTWTPLSFYNSVDFLYFRLLFSFFTFFASYFTKILCPVISRMSGRCITISTA